MEKLIVSVSFGTSALFKWKGKSCPDCEASLCCLGHGDILVMNGQCQDEFLHCTDPGLEQELINVTFRWIRLHAASCLSLPNDSSSVLFANVCAGFTRCRCGDGGKWRFGRGRERGCWLCWSTSSSVQGSGYAGACRWTCLLGGGRWGIICVTLGEFTGVHKSVPHVIMVMEVIPLVSCRIQGVSLVRTFSNA